MIVIDALFMLLLLQIQTQVRDTFTRYIIQVGLISHILFRQPISNQIMVIMSLIFYEWGCV